MTYGQRLEEQMDGRMFSPKDNDSNRAKQLFESIGSHGANPKKLAQLLAVWDYVTGQLGWNVKLSDTVTNYQASIDTRYHNDYKAVATIEELDRRMAMRRSNRNQGLIGDNT